jgi:hypothetical protein
MKIEIDETLWGERLEKFIEKFIPKTSRRIKSRDCGCEGRKQWLNDKHIAYRAWKNGY